MNRIFDKLINIDFYDEDNSTPIDKIVMPATGQKPNIGIQGQFITSQVVGNLTLRIVNFYPSQPLNRYKSIIIRAGYKDNQDTATIKGQIMVAYQESPSPDGVTYISFLPCDLESFLNTTVDLHFIEGDTLKTVLTSIVNSLSTKNQWSLSYGGNIILALPLDWSGTVKDCLFYLKKRFNILYDINGTVLSVYTNKKAKEVPITNINFVSSPPAASAAGITFVAPWMPDLRPGMPIHIDPKYFKQNFGAANVRLSSDLVVQTIEFQFNTVTEQNSMTVLALDTYEAL